MKRVKSPFLLILIFALTACQSRPTKNNRHPQLKDAESSLTASDKGGLTTQPQEADLEFKKEVDVLPVFKGGRKAMEAYINGNMQYPQLARQLNAEGRVIVAVRIDERGNLSGFKISQSDDSIFNAEALRIVRSMPPWAPAMKGGRPVATTQMIPVMFRLHPAE